jgi:hypothetical protein
MTVERKQSYLTAVLRQASHVHELKFSSSHIKKNKEKLILVIGKIEFNNFT